MFLLHVYLSRVQYGEKDKGEVLYINNNLSYGYVTDNSNQQITSCQQSVR